MPMPPELAARAISEIGIGFLFAPAIHPAMKHAQPARAELKLRTAFNLLGPLTNPAGARFQLIGAPSLHSGRLMAEALTGLDVHRAFVVHGADGMDEITTTGSTMVWDVRGGEVCEFVVEPESFGIPRAAPADLLGGGRGVNARIALDVLGGQPGPKRDIVLVNAAAALVVAGHAKDWAEGMEQAAEALDRGFALEKLRALTAFRG
jgi:anthranilate phosphoribosyltransferase